MSKPSLIEPTVHLGYLRSNSGVFPETTRANPLFLYIFWEVVIFLF